MRRLLAVLVWALVSTYVIILITLPINLQAHLMAGAIAIASMIVLRMIRNEGIWRLVALALGTAIVLRYVYWRTTSTLPPLNQPEDFIPGFLLYLAEMYSVLMLTLSVFIVATPLPPRTRRGKAMAMIPSVDVFIPTYNEEPELLARTIAAAQAMDYPPDRLVVWLLDDGGTVQRRRSERPEDALIAENRHHALMKLCGETGARYLTRERNEHAKAGNLNNGLAHSQGELIAVFDADHAPARDFLTETVGYFEDDPRLFLVQTPHFFLNPDPLERNLRTFDKMPSENEMFYGIIQRGLDKWNASFFCGSAAVLRRTALEETDGFSGISITEDCETAVELHSRKWNSVYVDRPMIAGLQPATFASFIGQRSRWAQGMMQILRFRFPPLKPGLSLPQRLCYMSSMLFWLFPFSRAIFFIAPLCYLFFDLEIFVASGAEFFAYTLSYMLVNMMMQNYLYGPFRWPWISELYEYVQTIHLLPAIVLVMLHPSKPTFKVTAKDESIDRNRLSEIGMPFFVVFAVLLAGVVMAALRIYYQPFKADVTLVVGGWNLINLIVAGCALGVVSERSEGQSARRVPVRRACEIQVGEQWMKATIEDASVDDARVRLLDFGQESLSDGLGTIRLEFSTGTSSDTLPVQIRGLGRDGKDAAFECRFIASEARHYRLIADLIFADSNRWVAFQRSRRRDPGLVRGTLWFLWTGIYQTGRGLAYLTGTARSTRAVRELRVVR